MSARLLAATIVALTLGLACPAAQAKTYCVNVSDCPAGGLTASTIEDAVTAADAAADADEVRVGAGTYPEGSFTADKETDIVGAGIGKTLIVPTPGSSGIQLSNGSSSISDLSMRFDFTNVQSAIRLQNGADATRVEITTSNDSYAISGFVAEDPGTILSGVRTDFGPSPIGSAAYFFEGGLVVDSTLVGGIGVSMAGTTVRRSTIRASIGLRAFGTQGSVARSNVITAHPRGPGSFSSGVDVVSGNSGESASLTASHLTIAGPGSGGTGLSVRSNSSSNAGTASLTVDDTVVRGTGLAFSRSGRPSPQGANLAVSYSSFNGAAIDNGGNGVLSLGSNLSGNPDPKWVDPASLDFRPRYDSPLIDQGDPSAFGSDIYGDRLNLARVRDGNGSDGQRRDIGALEYQRLAPTAAFSATPLTPLVGAPVSFTNASADPDGDPLTFAWAFGDGAAATDATPSHAYDSAGARQATLTATDPTGLAANASTTITVSAPDVVAPPNVTPPAVTPTPTPTPAPAAAEKAPVLSGASLLRTRFTVTGRKAKRGTRISYTLSKAARVTVSLERTTAGRRSGKRCVAATRRNRTAQACTRTIKAGTLTLRGRAGAQSVDFSGRVGSRALTAGRYRARLVAVDPQGRRSGEARLSFTVLRR